MTPGYCSAGRPSSSISFPSTCGSRTIPARSSRHGNWPFFPLDVAAALTVFLGAYLARVGSRIGDLVLTVGLMLTFCAGFMAISFWSFCCDFDPLWWGPNALLMIIPALALGSMACHRLGTAEDHS